MTEETKKPKSELAAEMESLAQQLGATLRAAWYSQERRDIQAEIETGLQDMSESLKQVSQEIAATPAAQRVKAEADTYRERTKEGDLGRKVQADLAAGLRAVSEQLRKLADTWTPLEKPDADSKQ
jgi:uncharacterized protein (DUF2164 family)